MEIAGAEFSIRRIVPQDYDSLIEIWRAAGSDIHTRGRESRDAIARHLSQFGHLSFAAESGGRIIGVVLGTHDGRKGWINRLAVLEEWRRRGVAGALVRACDAAIREDGIEIVAALVESYNRPSAELFRKLGYSDAVEVRYFRKTSHDHV